jgi:hypothetical protein
VQLGKRLYDPALGRFLSRDPLLIPRTAATTNPYSFAMNDPINMSDPSGMDADPINGGSLYASNNAANNGPNSGSQFSDGSPVAAGILAGTLLHYFGVKIGSWFTSSVDQAAFDSARDLQMAITSLTAQFAAAPRPDQLAFHRGLLRAARDTVTGTARLIADPDAANELVMHPDRIIRGLLKTDEAILSGDQEAWGYGTGVLASSGFGGQAGDAAVLDDVGVDAVSLDDVAPAAVPSSTHPTFKPGPFARS